MPIIKLDTLHLIARSMICLHSLYCTLSPFRGAALVLPPLLRRLTLKFTGPASFTLSQVQAAIDSIGRLGIESLDLDMPLHWSELSFAPLKSIARLTSLRLNMGLKWDQTFSPAQIADLRSLSHLSCMDVVRGMRQLLDGDCSQLRWQEVSYVHGVDERDVQCLSKLPSLTRLSMRSRPQDLAFLSLLPALTALDLQSTHGRLTLELRMDPQIWARLRSLTLGASHPATDLSKLFVLMPHLESLSLFQCSSLTSLALFNHRTLIQSLRSLTLTGWELRASDKLSYLHALTSLTALRLENLSIPGPIPVRQIAAFTPPSTVLPLLRSFWHNVTRLNADLEYEDSFGSREYELFDGFLRRTRARENMERKLKPQEK